MHSFRTHCLKALRGYQKEEEEEEEMREEGGSKIDINRWVD